MAFLTSLHLQQSQGKCHSRSFRVIIFYVVCFSFCFLCLVALGYGCPECSFTGKFFKFSRDLHCPLQNLECDHLAFLLWGRKVKKYRKKINVNHMCKSMKCTGADPGFFLGGGATPINHIVLFLQNTSCIRGGGVCTPCTLPLDPPLVHQQWLCEWSPTKWWHGRNSFNGLSMEGVQSFFLGWLNNPTK